MVVDQVAADGPEDSAGAVEAEGAVIERVERDGGEELGDEFGEMGGESVAAGFVGAEGEERGGEAGAGVGGSGGLEESAKGVDIEVEQGGADGVAAEEGAHQRGGRMPVL